ncbi:MAG: hypothetical protein M3032_04995 [Verrucomicrobiota bacterium]|nr:hypothetical protein [Verrucomicrobiota bacterium]
MLRRSAATTAFTLLEIVIALAVLGTMAAGCYTAFNAINTYAVSSRLFSEAQVAAQNQIDLILSREPFDISAAYISGTFDPSKNKIPLELMLPSEIDSLATSGVSFPAAAPSSTPVLTSKYYPYYPYYRSGTGQTANKQAFIYQDPVTGKVVVTGTTTTTISDASMTMTFVSTTPTNLNVRRANVTVSYTFRNRNYAVSMDTLRTADQ